MDTIVNSPGGPAASRGDTLGRIVAIMLAQDLCNPRVSHLSLRRVDLHQVQQEVLSHSKSVNAGVLVAGAGAAAAACSWNQANFCHCAKQTWGVR